MRSCCSKLSKLLNETQSRVRVRGSCCLREAQAPLKAEVFLVAHKLTGPSRIVSVNCNEGRQILIQVAFLRSSGDKPRQTQVVDNIKLRHIVGVFTGRVY